MKDRYDIPRIAFSAAIVLLFGWALIWHYNTGLEEALKNVLLIVFGFWLGSAKPHTGEPQSVEVTNPPSRPVQTESAA